MSLPFKQYLVKDKWFVTIAICVLFCALAVGRLCWLTIGPDSWGPRFACAESIYDFGEISKNHSVAHEYIIRNTGRKLLHILEITPGCGACLKAEISKKEIAPGDNAVLKIVLDVSKLGKGEVAKKLLVKTDDPNYPNVILYVTGTVTEDANHK